MLKLLVLLHVISVFWIGGAFAATQDSSDDNKIIHIITRHAKVDYDSCTDGACTKLDRKGKTYKSIKLRVVIEDLQVKYPLYSVTLFSDSLPQTMKTLEDVSKWLDDQTIHPYPTQKMYDGLLSRLNNNMGVSSAPRIYFWSMIHQGQEKIGIAQIYEYLKGNSLYTFDSDCPTSATAFQTSATAYTYFLEVHQTWASSSSTQLKKASVKCRNTGEKS